MLFKEIFGYNKIKDLLLRSVAEERVPHAQLFLGPKGSANLSLALAYAQYLGCISRGEEDSCGICSSCVKHEKFSHPDLHFVFPVTTTSSVKTKPVSNNFLTEWRDALSDNMYFSLFDWLKQIGVENKQGTISVEESAQIFKCLSLKPFESEIKTMLIWMPEKMNIQAANKLLKLLEEPPSKTCFLLVAEQTEKILSTVLSRTQLLRIPAHKDSDVEAYLISRDVDSIMAAEVSVMVEGDLNYALQITEDNQDFDQNALNFVQWMRFCFSALQVKDIDKLVRWSDSMAKSGREKQKFFLLYATNIMRDALLKNYGLQEMMKINVSGNNFTMDKFSPFIHADNCMEILEELNMAYLHIERNANPKILFLDTSFKIARLLHKKLKQAIA
jgi:DNA polymerase-3 subunit delta'